MVMLIDLDLDRKFTKIELVTKSRRGINTSALLFASFPRRFDWGTEWIDER
jgi:hypothetical protein